MTDEQTDLAFKVIGWMNEHDHPGGVFETPLGLLHIWWEHLTWNFNYLKVLPLPEDLKGEQGD